jgi:carboxyl-terminal processing protease
MITTELQHGSQALEMSRNFGWLTEYNRYLVAFILLVLGLTMPGVSRGDSLDEEIQALQGFSQAYHLIQAQHLQSQTTQQLIRYAIEGMVSRLDPYAAVYDTEELKRLESHAVGKYAGIGISIQKVKGLYVVTQVINGSPSEQAGLLPGDILVQLGGATLGNQRDNDLSRLVHGEIGTPLLIGFYHPENPDDIIKRSIVRELIKTTSVNFFERDSATAVIQIQQFQKSTPAEVESVLEKKDYQGVILDLRNNPGGLFLAAVETAEIFIKSGEIGETRDRENKLIERYVSQKFDQQKSPALIVLINRYSASSAEIVAGAIKDRDVGLIVGEQSFGKGVVQSIFPLGNGLFVKMTTARYLTPSGVSFHEIGIEPDHLVADIFDIIRYSEKDPIYAKALLLLDRLRNNDKPIR